MILSVMTLAHSQFTVNYIYQTFRLLSSNPLQWHTHHRQNHDHGYETIRLASNDLVNDIHD